MFGASIAYNAGSMPGFTGPADSTCSTKKGFLKGEGVFFFSFLSYLSGVWRLRPCTGISPGLLLLLLICYSSGNMETTQRLGIDSVTDHRLWRMNGEYNINMFFMFY